MIHRQKCMMFYIRVSSHIGLAFVFIFSFPNVIKCDCGRNGYNDDNERHVMSYNPELSYRMAILSVVASDLSHPQHCLDQYLPAAKFQLQTVFTEKNCDFVQRKCSGYIAVSHALRVMVDRRLSWN